MSAEGSLSIGLGIAEGRVKGVSVVSSRPTSAAKVLRGRSTEEVLRLVPLLFPVCGMAQGIACARAIDAAEGREPDPRIEGARSAVSLAEATASHLFQFAIAWRRAAGAAPDLGVARKAREHAASVASALLAGAPDLVKAASAVDALAELAKPFTEDDSPLVAEVVAADRASFGPVPIGPSPALDVRTVGARLAADPAFGERPHVDGQPVDASAFASCVDDDELCDLPAAERTGLLGRLLARRVEARRHLAALRARVKDIALEGTTASLARRGASEGVGAASTARGPLVHWVRLAGRDVADVRVVAPTDWTFHPAGALALALTGVAATPTLARDASWLVLAMDPCVPFTVEVRDA
jgi:coenzyme F420-reducing hydrogenase alpha subunit